MRVENKTITPYTIMCMVAPTGTGKSYWAGRLKEKYPDLVVISSDEERRQLIGDSPYINQEQSHYRYSPEMAQVSGPAFHVLKAKVESYCQCSSQHILVDSTGSPATIDLIKPIAKRFNYSLVALVMEFADSGYYEYAIDRDITSKSIKQFKRKSLSNLTEFIRLEIKDRDLFPTLIRESKVYLNKFSVIGDLHQEIDKANELIPKLEGTLIFLGDYFDTKKSEAQSHNSILKTLDFLEEQISKGNYLIRGNHENYIYGRLTNKHKACEIEPEYFNSVNLFLQHEDLKERFIQLYSYMPIYIKVCCEGRDYSLTHAPVGPKYRCRPGQKANYKCYYPSTGLYDFFSFVNNDSNDIFICGHVAHKGTLTPYPNKWFIDTGAAYGGMLTGLICTRDSQKPRQVGETDTGLPTLDKPKEIPIEYQYRAQRLLKEECSFISGTMSPGPASDTELEPLTNALNLFKQKGIRELVLDTKHMGSRCNAYVTEDKVILRSRSGVILNSIEIPDTLISSLQDIRRRLRAKSIIIDGELMPWSTLGQGLIEQYSSKLWIYKNIANLALNSTEGLEETEEVLSYFSSQEDPYFLPFSILKVEYEDRIEYPEWEWDMVSIKEKLQVEKYITIPSDDFDKASQFFNELTVNQHLEGIVIRPLLSKDRHLIPYLKVRGKEYLRLIYGPDYLSQSNLERLIRNKNIQHKLNLSIKEWREGFNMISSSSSEDRLASIVELLGHLDEEKALDPGL